MAPAQSDTLLGPALLVTGAAGIAALTWLCISKLPAFQEIKDAASTDPGLLKARSTFKRYETPSGHVYPRIRTFYNEHTQAKKLPADLPLFVLMHGLGGSAAQFAPLLNSLTRIAPCLAIDLPGCGLSAFEPDDITAYTTTAFAELLFAAIQEHRNKEVDQKVVLIGHSMGCSIAALLASSSSSLQHLCSDIIISVVAICPRSRTVSETELRGIQRINYLPSFVFDLIRMADRRGGVESLSVSRVIGKEADLETKKLQLRFNQQSKSAVFQKITTALAYQETKAAKQGEESVLGRRIWNGMKIPLFLVAAEDDKLAPPAEVEQIQEWLTTTRHDSVTNKPAATHSSGLASPDPDSTLPAVAGDAGLGAEQITRADTNTSSPPIDHISEAGIQQEEASTKHAHALKTCIFPAPSSHGLLYSTSDVRILSGLIENFLARHVDERLSPGWQLQHLTTSGKWDVKNLKKWQAVAPCSEPIAGVFRAMKTMREIDEEHSPLQFVTKYSWKVIPDGVAMVVDISLDAPVYDKQGLEEGGVEYHKFPTVSKLPPGPDEVEQFIALIASLRESPKLHSDDETKPHPTIGVHCHYGFNRTGFLIICYLVEQLGWELESALEEFAQKRPPGIKHDYFVNELYVRYKAAKMDRRGTIV
ncbi:Putative tyrosine-specific protein phosphatase [Septoria linicola]|uniref:Tyrosine-specific protein phosphatase n=1 Tax=Septoria linicola TaxID=215465 RepID=A0A9Q9AMA8_9PEZI|nr:putative tyrosine-specific protein phosphatase [Septoria linicola]USW49568.1 Putative tyrosine-specific protein phosphatase [Septoria linicola]